MELGSGFTSSVVGGLYGGQGSTGGAGQAGAPAASSGPTGRPSLVAAAFGTDSSVSPAGNIAGYLGAAAWAGLLIMWWVLPR